MDKIAIVIDESGSMFTYRKQVVALHNSIVESLKEKKNTQISLYYFGGNGVTEVFKNKRPADVPPLGEATYSPEGQTPLYDGVIEAVNGLKSRGKTTSYMVMVLTDGQENHSKTRKETFLAAIREKQATDYWTFAFLLPPQDVKYFQNLTGIHEGNLQAWQDFTIAEKAAHTGLNNYYEARKRGETSCKAVFTTDLSNVSKKDVTSLTPLKNVKMWSVAKEEAIQPFVEGKGLTYKKGAAYYQLTKPEDVQDYKGILIMVKGQKKVYDDARAVIGLPTTGTVKVKPGNHSDYDIFVQSTSVNRKLVRGTKLLYKE